MNQFSKIQSNVGTRIGDTSVTFAVTIGNYINQRYQRIFKKFNWDSITPGYTFNTTAGTNEYIAPAGFGKELYVFDNTNGVNLVDRTLGDLEIQYPQNLNDNGNPIKYAIYKTLDGSSPANIVTKLRLYPNPTSVIQIIMPYLNAANTLSASTDLPILDMSDLAAELGATADSWRTKRQFEKAADFEVQYEQVISEMIWSQENQPNRVVHFSPNVYPKDSLY